MKRKADLGEALARGGNESRRFKLPVVADDCDQPGVCLKLTCPLNTTLDVNAEGEIKFQHGKGMGEARAWSEAGDEPFMERVVTWLAEVGREQLSFAWSRKEAPKMTGSNCVRELVRRHGAMEMEQIAGLLGISKELAYQDLRSGVIRMAQHPESEALREGLIAAMGRNEEGVEPDHDLPDEACGTGRFRAKVSEAERRVRAGRPIPAWDDEE